MAPPLSSRSTSSLNQPQPRRQAMRENAGPKQAAIRTSTSSPSQAENRNTEFHTHQSDRVDQDLRAQLERQLERESEQSIEVRRREMRQQPQPQHQHPRPGQAGLNRQSASITVADIKQYVRDFAGKLVHRFGTNSDTHRRFAQLLSSQTPSRDLLPDIVSLFGNGSDLFRDFQAHTNTFDQYRRLIRDQDFRRNNRQSQALQTTPRKAHRPARSNGNNNSRNYDGASTDGDDDGDDSDGSYDDGDGAIYDPNGPSAFSMLKDSQHKEIQKLLSMPEIDIAPGQRKNTPAAMSCKLLPHQRVSLTWMTQQELDQHKKGGLLADTMGLGKTIQALALILDRPSTNHSRKTTLIVAPLALLKQWEQEIQTKVKPRYKLKTIIYHGRARLGMTVTRLLEYDVVLTTYGIIRSESYDRKKTSRPIINAYFYRVILDEAHNIKNRLAKSSIAAAQIQAEYRWCMTGTPFMNRTEEIYSLLRFLRIKPYNVWEKFNEDIDKPIKSLDEDFQGVAMQKLQALFRSITLRRTKTSILDDKPILDLPELVRVEAMTVFNDEQKAFYDALEKKQQLKVNAFVKAGTLARKYTYILVLLLRLRQACCHPHLIRDFGIPEGAQLTSDEMRDLAKQLKKRVVETLKGQTEFDCPVCGDATEDPLIIYPCGHLICSTCFSALMEIRNPMDEKQCQCYYPNCISEIDPEGVICHCFFVEVHMPEKYDSEASEDDLEDESDGFKSLDEDDDIDARGNLKGFIASDSEIDYEDGSEEDEDEDRKIQDEDDSGCLDANDGKLFTEPKLKELSVSRDEISKVAPKEESTENSIPDSDNESMPDLEDVWRRRSKMARPKSEPEPTKRETTPHSISNSQTSVKREADSQSKRKRSSGKEVNRPRKKSKRNDGASRKRRKGKKKEFVSLAALKKASSSNAAAKAKYLKQLRRDWVPSAKIEKTMELLQEIRANNPKEKTLIFSLWTSFLDLLEIPIHDEGFQYTRYDGTMLPNARDAAVKAFMDNPDMQIMMISLTAGNTGLNLMKATQVIILEPFWNPFVEEQAIDRAHRIGQKNKVTVHRLLVENTVEDRIRALQESKRQLVNTALSEEGAQGVSRLSINELKGLFGLK
ncbi:G protein-coupled receptor gpr1 [Hypoxylon texense]